MSYGAMAPGGASAARVVTRKMPGQRTNISTGSTTLLNTGTRRSALDRVGESSQVNAPIGQPATVPSNPTPSGRRALFTQPLGMGSRRFNTVTTDGVSRKRKDVPFGGNSEAELNEMQRWAGGRTSAKLPRLGGLPAPDMSREVRGEMGYPMYANFAAKPNPFPSGPLPNSRTPGTGGIAWGNFGEPSQFLDTEFPSPSPGAFPGTAADSRFITPGEQIVGGVSRTNPFLTYPYGKAEANIISDGQIEERSNAVIPYHFILETNYAEFCEENQEHQIMMLQRKPFPMISDDYVDSILERSPFVSASLLNLPMWNYMNACNEKAPSQMGRSLTVQEVLKEWSLIGVCYNDPSSAYGPGSQAGYPNKPGQHQRLINAAVGGPAFVKNYWGNGIRNGQKVYLMLKKVPLEDIRPSGQAPTGSYDISAKEGIAPVLCDGETRSPAPFQLVPWVPPRNFSTPTLADRQYRDEFGQLRYAAVFELGQVIQIDNFDTRGDTLRYAPYSMKATLALSDVRIIVDIKRVA